MNPCLGCRTSCCGCEKQRNYNKDIQIYKDRNIYDLAKNIKRINALEQEINQLKKKNELL